MLILRYALAALVMLGMGIVTPVHADGKHGVKVEVINNSSKRVSIWTWNGDDPAHGSLISPHKVRHADQGETRMAKAHGNGTHRLWLMVTHEGRLEYCTSSAGDYLDGKITYRDGAAVTVSHCDVQGL